MANRKTKKANWQSRKAGEHIFSFKEKTHLGVLRSKAVPEEEWAALLVMGQNGGMKTRKERRNILRQDGILGLMSKSEIDNVVKFSDPAAA